MADMKTKFEVGDRVQVRSSGRVGRIRRIVVSYFVALEPGGRYSQVVVETQLQKYPLLPK